jgi:hypothetical protein
MTSPRSVADGLISRCTVWDGTKKNPMDRQKGDALINLRRRMPPSAQS